MRALRFLAVGLLASCARPTGQSTRAGDFDVTVSLQPDPPTTGENRLRVTLADGSGRPVEGAALELEADMPQMGAMPEMRGGGEARALGEGRYEVGYPLQMEGDWTLTLGIRAAGHPPAQLRLTVAPPRKGFLFATQPAGALPSGVDGGASAGAPWLDLPLERQQRIGVTFATVEEKPLVQSLRVAGRVDVDERQLADVALKYEAYVRKLFVSETGKVVRVGEPLLELYSPDLLSAEEELLQTMNGGGGASKDALVRAAERRLRLWDLTPAQIETLEQGGKADGAVVVHSPAAGVVLEKAAVEGTHAMPGMTLYRIGNLGRVWVQADVYELDAASVAVGQVASVTLPALPEQALEGRVSFVAPTVDEKTRTVRARIELTNAKQLLKPGMFADVRIEAPLGTVLAVPEEALLLSGEHAYAFVERGPGKLQAVELRARRLGGGEAQVLSGLSKGDRVVSGASFLVSSEAQLRSALPRWSQP